MTVDNTNFIRQYLGEHYGRINPPRLLVHADGTADFDFGTEQLYFSGANCYGGITSWYLYYKIGREWVESELTKSAETMHPLAQWHQVERQQIRKRKDDRNAPFSGAEICWRFLGYHLTLISEHAVLSSKLIKRLRNGPQFQGARFEIAVAAAMIVAGFDLEYVREKGPGKHPEFIATDIETGMRFAVEAKSCHRNDIMGFVKEEDDQSLSVAANRQLRKGIEKNTELPLLVFVDLNIPDAFPAEEDPIFAELEIAKHIDATRWKEEGCPCVGGVFYNDAAVHRVDEDIDLGKKYAWVVPFSFENRHHFDPTTVLLRITRAFAKAARIPDINWHHPGIPNMSAIHNLTSA